MEERTNTTQQTITPQMQQQIDEAQKLAKNSNGQPIIIINNTEQKPSQLEEALTGKTKNKWIAFLLCLFLWEFGLYQFYCGWVKKGVIMLILSFTGIGLFINIPWAIYNLIQILTDKFQVKDGSFI